MRRVRVQQSVCLHIGDALKAHQWLSLYVELKIATARNAVRLTVVRFADLLNAIVIQQANVSFGFWVRSLVAGWISAAELPVAVEGALARQLAVGRSNKRHTGMAEPGWIATEIAVRVVARISRADTVLVSSPVNQFVLINSIRFRLLGLFALSQQKIDVSIQYVVVHL